VHSPWQAARDHHEPGRSRWGRAPLGRPAGKDSVDYSQADPWTCGARGESTGTPAAAAPQSGGSPAAAGDGVVNTRPVFVLPEGGGRPQLTTHAKAAGVSAVARD
jgi:hypothetical protein